ncbi:hypothetical protein SMACR_08486 [Sordaria macrospora]|uniref:WGS project CABT00000000 data, contig 2.58 n=2 Tax=Sordaria macrospora TaxID=5147 RepID=F7WA82_SORMK|nr:uncharacterized protein SMAC_08486 [Sordaria macrospora k-hell]KAA8634850.1 hypothetical protein SMACR_08486 [Sordaria macrospora]WPJ58113.1 hypothetical protein SMAC4_08486 [Sordaria macrospora]CCC14145.1 unnamed protein product [Sordaria macrospora k-hell]
MSPTAPTTAQPTIQILPGYRPGILGRTLEMHMDFYSSFAGWGPSSEAGIASGLVPFLKRLGGDDVAKGPQKSNNKEGQEDAVATTDGGEVVMKLPHGRSQVWSAVQVREDQENQKDRIVGVVYVDGDFYRSGERKEEGGEEVCRLRFYIVDEEARGLGVGGKLFAAAMGFVRDAGFRECRLSTWRQLETARRLYEREGFVVAEEEIQEYTREDDGRQQVLQWMNYVWRRDSGDSEKRRADIGTEAVVH